MATICVLAAIDLDNKTGLPAYEIREIRPDRQLSNEFEAVEAAPPKLEPERLFRIVLHLP